MNIEKWLDGLAAALGKNLTPLQAYEYLQELKSWNLTDEQWLQVKSLAKRRTDPRFFASISELDEIMREVKRQGAAVAPGSAPDFELFSDDAGRCWAKPKHARRMRKAG